MDFYQQWTWLNKCRYDILEEDQKSDDSKQKWLGLVKARDKLLRKHIKEENASRLNNCFIQLKTLLKTIGEFRHDRTPSALRQALSTLYWTLDKYLDDNNILQETFDANLDHKVDHNKFVNIDLVSDPAKGEQQVAITILEETLLSSTKLESYGSPFRNRSSTCDVPAEADEIEDVISGNVSPSSNTDTTVASGNRSVESLNHVSQESCEVARHSDSCGQEVEPQFDLTALTLCSTPVVPRKESADSGNISDFSILETPRPKLDIDCTDSLNNTSFCDLACTPSAERGKKNSNLDLSFGGRSPKSPVSLNGTQQVLGNRPPEFLSGSCLFKVHGLKLPTGNPLAKIPEGRSSRRCGAQDKDHQSGDPYSIKGEHRNCTCMITNAPSPKKQTRSRASVNRKLSFNNDASSKRQPKVTHASAVVSRKLIWGSEKKKQIERRNTHSPSPSRRLARGVPPARKCRRILDSNGTKEMEGRLIEIKSSGKADKSSTDMLANVITSFVKDIFICYPSSATSELRYIE